MARVATPLATLHALSVYPIKGMAGLTLDQAVACQDAGLLNDRRFALTTDPAIDGSAWYSSRSFLINAINDNLLTFEWQGSAVAGALIAPSGERLEVDLADDRSVDGFNAVLPDFLASVVSPELKVRLVQRRADNDAKAYWDYQDSQVLLVNQATIDALAEASGHVLDARRFRCNLLVQGLAPWEELCLAGKRVAIGDAQIEFTRPARRCPAIGVNPDTGKRDIELHKLLMQKYGHGYFGIYGRIVHGGTVHCGQELQLLGDAGISFKDAQVALGGPYALWPKLAVVENIDTTNDGVIVELGSATGWPLFSNLAGQSIKLHLGTEDIVQAKIVGSSANQAKLMLSQFDLSADIRTGAKIIVTGPYKR